MYGGTRRNLTRERIITSEVMKLEQRQARQRAANSKSSQGRPEARAQVFVEDWPEAAFQVFIEEAAVGSGRYIRFRRDEAGRFVELYDAATGDGLEIARVTVWAPGARLMLTWREPDWPAGASTEVDIHFEAMFGGTLVRIQHSGFERLGPQALRVAADYRAAWTAALGCVASGARAAGKGGDHPVEGRRSYSLHAKRREEMQAWEANGQAGGRRRSDRRGRSS